MPEGYLAQPVLLEHSLFVWQAFMALSSDRQIGMGLGRIPFTAIDRYAERYGLDDLDAFDDFRSLIEALDAEYLRLREPNKDQ